MEIENSYLEHIAQQLARLCRSEAKQVAERAVELVREEHGYCAACDFRRAIDVEVETEKSGN